MECDDIQSQLSSWVDGEAVDSDSNRIQGHLESCSECQAVELQLRSVHGQLSKALSSERDRAQMISEQILGELASPISGAVSTPKQKIGFQYWAGWGMSCLLSAVAGFLFAVVWIQPQMVPHDQKSVEAEQVRLEQPIVDNRSNETESTSKDPVRVHLVRATGRVEIFPPTEDVWTPVETSHLADFPCPDQGAIRTEQGSLCELKTLTGDVIRLDESSEIRMRTEEEFELIRGQLWCRTSPESKLRVYTPADAIQGEKRSRINFLCYENSETFASCDSGNSLRVAITSGTVDIIADGLIETATSGATCQVSDGKVEFRSNLDDLVAAKWMVPLLTLSGHGDPELSRRVDAMLARIGRTKLSRLYEKELRSLGEFGSLPLLRFVQAEESQLEMRQRRVAMLIIADTAPIWMVPDLIDLLKDDDAEVRYLAASGLSRLTGEDRGSRPEDWRNSKEVLADQLSDWQHWWQQNRFSFPKPPVSTVAKE